MKLCMLGEHTMTVNFSYRAIPNLILDLNGGHFRTKYYKRDNHKYANLTFDLNGGHFPKWPPEYTCFNISVSNSRRKKILVSKHTFSRPRITKKTIINTQIQYFTIMAVIFSKWPSEYTWFNVSVSN